MFEVLGGSALSSPNFDIFQVHDKEYVDALEAQKSEVAKKLQGNKGSN